MKNKSALSALILILLLGLFLASCRVSGAGVATGRTEATLTSTREAYSDPFAYCAAIGQIDTPDARYTGPKMPEALFKDYLKAAGLDTSMDYPDAFKKMTIWRCMDHNVYACNFGANIPCDSKADTSRTPTQAMLDYCKESHETPFIPMSVTGHAVIYSWQCVDGSPEIQGQPGTVDAAGYNSSFWTLLPATP